MSRPIAFEVSKRPRTRFSTARRRVSSALSLTVVMLLAALATPSVAAAGDSAETAPQPTTAFGLPLMTVAWAMVGLLSFVTGLVLVARRRPAAVDLTDRSGANPS